MVKAVALVEQPESPIVGRLKGVHLFHYDGAPCAQRVRFALYEKGLMRGREVKFDASDEASLEGEDCAWVSRQVSLVKKDHMTETYAQIQPNLVVPALVHDGQLHIESMEIIEYLDGVFGGEALIPRHNRTLMADAQALTELGEGLHRSIRFVTFRWGLRGLARLNGKEERQLRSLLKDAKDGEQLIEFYEGYDANTIAESVYLEHLDQLNEAFQTLEARLSDGRAYLTGDDLTMADIIWAMKTLRLSECDYPFDECFPNCAAWYERLLKRRSFQEGVLGKHKMMSAALRSKARIERLLGVGLRSVVLRRVI